MSKIKTYKNAEVAAKISVGKPGTAVYEIETGKFAVMTVDEFNAHAAAKNAPAPEAAKSTPAPAATAAKLAAAEVVTVTIPGAHITKQYVITKEAVGERPRWFEIKRLASVPVKVDGGVQFNCTRGTLASRGLKDMAAKAPLAK